MKKLFSLVALSTLLVACSQEDLIPQGEAISVNLGNRPTLGQVTFDLGSKGPQTRMDFQTSFNWTWENGDKVGAAIIDAPITTAVTGFVGSASATWTYAEYVMQVKKNVGGTDVLVTETFTASNGDIPTTAAEFYDSAEYISTNYPYEIQDSKFTTQANLVEGNYMFYAPYSSTHLTREAIQVVTPMKQDCSDEVIKDTKYQTKDAKVSSTSLRDFYKGTTEGFENIPVAVGYQFLGAPADRSEVIKPSLEMHDLFAYPMITIANNFNGYLFDNALKSISTAQKPTMVLDSVQIYTTSTVAIDYKQTIQNSALDVLKEGGDWTTDKYIGSYTNAIINNTSAYNDAEYFDATDATYAINAPLTNMPTYVQKHITCDLGGKELAQGASYHFHAILPAADYEQKLFAKVFVKIGGVRYTIFNGTVNPITTAGADKDKANAVDGTFTDYNFRDKVNGDQNARFVRGEHYPAPELNESGEGTKSFAGTMMTINLTGGKTQAAFALAEKASYNGFVDNADFIDYMTNDIQRGVYLQENELAATAARGTWKTAFPATGVGTFAFADTHTCIINAELIKALKDRMYQNATTGFQMNLVTNLPIANDVKFTVKAASGTMSTTHDEYTFATLDGAATYVINMLKASAGTDGTALVAGINNIITNATLKMKKDNSNAVVNLGGTAVATLTSSTGISAIYVNANTTLNVNAACSSLIIMNGGTIVIGQGGSLTNTNNVFTAGAINNTNLRTIAGTVKEGVVISASAAVWPTSSISANTKINSLTITLTGELTLDQTQVGKLGDLTDVNVVLAATVTEISSNSNVILTNIKSMKSEATSDISWNKAGTGTVTVTYKKNASFFTKITAGTDVTFVSAD